MHRKTIPLIAILAVIALTALPGGADAQAGEFLDKPLTEWVRELADARTPVRRSAAFALGKAGKRAAFCVPELVSALDDKEAKVREAAAYALGEIGPTTSKDAIPALRRVLVNDADARARRSAAFALGSYGPHAAVAESELQGALKDAEAIVRQNAAWALGRLGESADPASVHALSKLLRPPDPDPLVRRDAAGALGDIRRPRASSAVDVLIGCFNNDKDLAVRKTVVAALVDIVGPDDKESAADLKRAFLQLVEVKADPELLRNAALALGNIGGSEAKDVVPLLSEALQDEDVVFRRQAAAALANIGPNAAPAVKPLTAALADPDANVRRNAALALSRIGPPALPAVPALIKAFEDKEPEVRRYAVEAVESLGTPAVEQAVEGLKVIIEGETDRTVRQRAVESLGRLPDIKMSGLIPILERVLLEKDHETRLVRYAAALVLGSRLGPEASDRTLDVLLENLNDKSIRIYQGTAASVAAGSEAKRGDDKVTESGAGDARWLPANVLGIIGRKVAKRADIIESLKEAAQAEDPKVKKIAGEALAKIRK